MKPDKKQEADVLKVYDAWWHSYLTGDVKTYDSLLDDEYRFVGSTNGEEFLNRKDTTKFFELTADQLAGKAELRNLTRTIEKLDSGHILITDLADAYVISEPEWVFYSRFRFTSLMKETKNGWRFIYQHFSAPDTKAQEGETLGTEQITKENQELRDAIKRRTVELENKTRALEIEASLERVRTVAMGMNKPDDMLDICRIISQQLELLHVKEIRNVQTAIIYEAKGSYLNFEYYAKHEKTFITDVDFKLHPAQFEFVNRMLKGPEEFFNKHFNGKEVQDWYAYQQTTNQFADAYLATATSLNYYWYSMGPVALGISTYVPLTEEDIVLFKRFRNVFELAYRRFIDIEQAAAQAREAQIEVALERVRAKVMAMNSSKELPETSFVFGEQLRKLGIDWQFSYFWLIEEDKDDNTFWITWPDNQTSTTSYSLAEADQNFKDCIVAWKNQEKIHGTHVAAEYVKSWLDTFDRITTDAGGVAVDIMKAGNFKEGVYYYDAMIRFGSFGILMNRATTDEEKNIQSRFATEFERAYTRFMDLQKAEAQAREAQIETALERVRSRTMAMQKSEELKEVIKIVYQQLRHLKINLDHAGFVVDYTPGGDWHFWIADEQDIPAEITHPYFDSVWANQFNEAKEKGAEFFATHLNFEEKNKFYNELLSYVPGLPDVSKDFYLNCPGLAATTVLLDNVALYIENFSGIPYTEEENSMLMRFGKVFQQTYTRFLDLQKAEAQAKEAKIEAALERTRTQSMIMQHSKELDDTLRVFHQQVLLLGIDSAFSFLWLPDEEKDQHKFWAAWAENNSTDFYSKAINYAMDRNEPATAQCLLDWKSNEPVYSYHVSSAAVENYFAVWSELIAGVEQLKPGYFLDGLYYVEAFMKYGCFGVIVKNELKEDEKKILARFAVEFERTYTRFLDLQKAEAQAREAQIEAALEKVRSRTMAMQRSDELQDAAMLLVQQVKTLGVPTFGSGFNIWDDDRKAATAWMAGEQRLQPPFKTSTSEDVFLRIYEAGQRGETLFVEEQGGNLLKDHYVYLKSIPIFKEIADKLESEGLSLPTFQIMHCAFFSQGYLMFISFEPVPFAYDIFKRFAKVFEQTYTRFLDLQKAEAQAREAQIEAALERVRSRSMAMHKSDELLEAGEILFLEMQKLGIASLTAGYVLIDEEEKNGLNYTPHPGTKKIMPVPVIIPHNETIHMQQVVENWKKGNLFFIVEMDEEETIQHQTFIAERSTNFPLTAAQLIAISPARLFLHNFFFKEGYVLIVGGTKLSAEQTDIMLRLAKVFQQTYTRFLDLQKAEAQAREAKIEAALERVRSRSLAMHHSSELSAVVDTLLREFTNLEFTLTFCIINLIDEQDRSNTVWAANPETGKQPESYYMKFEDYPFHHAMWDAWKEQKKNFIYTLEGKEKKIYDEYLYTKTEFRRFPKHVQEANKALKRYVAGFTFFKYSGLQTVSENQISEDELKILERFGRVFEQSYTRFIDLQKAEAQAREAQIEASLERVRSKTMAMHNSREVGETVATMFEELVKLGVDKSIRCGIGILNDTRHMEVWTASTNKSGGTTLDIGLLDMTIHPLLAGVKEAWKNKKNGFIYELAGEDLKKYFIAINAAPDYPVHVDLKTLPDKIIHTDFFFSEGTLFAFSSNLIPEETAQVLKRFAGVFGQTYRRYLDLQKAEAQAREAQIEAALEKIRSHTNAMRSSEDLSNVATIMFEQMRILGGDLFSFGIVLCDRHANMVEQWHSIPGAGMIPPFFVPVDLDHIHRYRYDQWKAGVELFSVVIPEDYIKEHFRIMLELPSVKSVIDMMTANKIPLTIPDWEIDYGASFKYGYLLVSSLKPFEEDKIFPRFAKVFEQTYTRFLDLQKAEAQAREAQIEAAMEKVRSRSLAMQKPEELTEVAELLRKEMGQLGVEELETSSIYIVDKENEQAECWYAIKDIREENKRLVSDEMTITFADTWVGSEMKKFYRAKKQQASIVMKGDNRKEWINYCAGKSNVLLGYYGDEIPERTYHLVKFNGGYMGAASPGDISAESWDLLRRAASAFSLAYTRFNDLQIAEAHALQAELDLIAIKEAKQKAEEALSELQSTQKQLIQSEKMASLGELTAGIAHEIQNPLNFVNNFSEVSKELLDEMKEAIEKGNTEEAKEIMNDVIQNLEKINHHGKRADGIVKGMLQHSSSGSGKKEPTDINALADEYLRLAYHGLRAKDKSFNATMKTEFDESMGNINIIPQDIGRVILNLITNAFYVVNEKAKAEGGKLKASASPAGQPYEPTVEVSTKKVKDKVEIKVKDNGNGIPQKILDKIFQPFFTTKPTGEGTGLGLSLSYDIVKAHGGELKVETSEGKGSEFIIQLPINMNNG